MSLRRSALGRPTAIVVRYADRQDYHKQLQGFDLHKGTQAALKPTRAHSSRR